MLGYISSTRRKSCRNCVKSKRRCDLGYPCCKRCYQRHLDCVYATAPALPTREACLIIRQATPDLVPDALFSEQVQGYMSLDPALPSFTDSLGPESNSAANETETSPGLAGQTQQNEPSLVRLPAIQDQCEGPVRCSKWRHDHSTRVEASLSGRRLPQIWEPQILSNGQVVRIVGNLCAFVPALAYTGHTLFMHQNIYRFRQPAAYQDSCSLAALYLLKTSGNAPILASSIESKISSLISTSREWSLAEHLAAVQALLIYQIIRLFDPDLNLQSDAVKHNALLELWTAHLWKRSFNEPNILPTCYESWTFYESLRRTVLMSVFLRGAWSCITQDGLCDQVPVLAKLPLTSNGNLWNYDSGGEWERNGPCATGKQAAYLTAYGDFSMNWRADTPVETLNDFEKILLAACRGGEDARLLARSNVQMVS